MIRVLLIAPMEIEQIPTETVSVNSVEVSGVNHMALYYNHLPVPASIDPANILEIYDSEQSKEPTQP